jgi:putative pyruvate formate lyase activating enzyme
MSVLARPFAVTAAAPPPRRVRSALAARRADEARAMLGSCHLCAHHCGADRRSGPAGRCRAGPLARVFSAQTEVSDEIALGPTFAVAFSGCDLRCDFCITGRESWDGGSGEPLDAGALTARAAAALAAGARSVMFLGGEPTVHLPDALAFASRLPDDATLVWKTNAHASAEARALLDGVFDVWLPDFKFGNDACALRLARVENYTAVVRENLLWAAARHRVIVRHLLMPGHVECCWRPIAAWLAANLPGVEVSLRESFWPAWQSRRHPLPPNTACTLSDEDRRRPE